ncbi:TonB-dependent receptor [Sphingomonas koreensis]|nr:TonB-dependent receptor [Sphingomonas koreensis]
MGAGLVLGSGFAAPAFAQDATAPADAPVQATPAPAAASEGQDIVVTGTIFRNPSAETASPTTTLTSEDLANRGINTVADAIQTLSATNAGSFGSSWSTFGFATGASAPSLRGLNDAYTLTIFDGLRSAVYPLADDGSRNFVDINTIPDSIVDRIQVLQDGASATYGADAIAGVVNVIIKKEITGVHLNASSGISQRGDAGQQRLDATLGYGKLDEQGWNFWVNAEYQKDDPLFSRQRGYPFNTSDLSKICGSSLGGGGYSAGQTTCMYNGISNGIQANGDYGGFAATSVPFVRPWDPTGGEDGTGAYAGNYQLLDKSQGCRNLTPITLTDAQQASQSATGAPSVVCQQDSVKQYQQYNPSIRRLGGNARFTANIGSDAQAYVMFNYYQTKTDSQGSPYAYAGRTAAGGTQVSTSPLRLPVFVCPERVNCDTAADRVLNTKNNPFADLGQTAQLSALYLPTRTTTDAQTFRVTAGIDGGIGDLFDYNLNYTASRVNLDVDQYNNPNARHVLDLVADGTYDFSDPYANSQEQRDYLAPPSHNHSVSILQQVQGTISKDFFQLPGGAFQVAVGGAYRYESIDNPSANPANEADPYDRYYGGINAVGVQGSRNVKSAFFQANAPIFDALTLSASGRYDWYSSGQKNFSPKFEAQFRPIEQIKLRGTYSKGFRIPSFNEAYGLPTTGYVNTTVTADTPGGTAFLTAHGNDAYATGSHSYGLTAVGNPSLAPEKSRSFTLGVVFEPTRQFTFTVDYWNIKIKNLITGADTSGVVDAYYGNNGVVNIPGLTVTPGDIDTAHPDALPLLGNVQYSFQNADSSRASGLDFTGTARLPIGNSLHLTSTINASYIIHLGQTIGGNYQQYDGTLSPCNITSCSGAPKWRGNWQNTLDFSGKTTLSATIYYTGGYDLASTDYGGVPGDCLNNFGASVVAYEDGVTPVSCHTKKFIDVDMSASTKVTDHLKLYVDVLNVFDVKPPFDPSAAYSIYQFNPVWADRGFIGRYFRVGAKVDF